MKTLLQLAIEQTQDLMVIKPQSLQNAAWTVACEFATNPNHAMSYYKDIVKELSK
jgi:hypothetical protein